MLADAPSPALTLDLESRLRAAQPLAERKADRVHNLNLTGEMAGYVWSINEVAWNKDVPPLPVAKGERVELVMVNRTRMPHPMHLHGHEFQVVEIDGVRFAGAVRDTVLVPPGRRVAAAFDAENPGWWAFHCHLLYHLDAGMFTDDSLRVTLKCARSSWPRRRARRRSPGAARPSRRGRGGAREPRRAGSAPPA